MLLHVVVLKSLDPPPGLRHWFRSVSAALVSNNFALVTDSYEKTIFQVDLSSDSHNFTAIALEGLKNPIAVDYDPVDSKIYFTDVIAKRVVRANLDGTEMEDLAVDYVVGE